MFLIFYVLFVMCSSVMCLCFIDFLLPPCANKDMMMMIIMMMMMTDDKARFPLPELTDIVNGPS